MIKVIRAVQNVEGRCSVVVEAKLSGRHHLPADFSEVARAVPVVRTEEWPVTREEAEAIAKKFRGAEKTASMWARRRALICEPITHDVEPPSWSWECRGGVAA